MVAMAVDLSAADRLPGLAAEESSAGFKTDTGISGFSGNLRERELIAWTPDESLEEMALEVETQGGKQWDQFATNQKLFGVKTTFDEEVRELFILLPVS